MDKHLYREVAKSSALFTNIIFCLVHVAFIIFFATFGVDFMVKVNIFSLLTYIIGFYIIKINKVNLWIWVMAIEVWIHMILAVICIGTGCGFQYCFLGMCSVYSYAEYFSKKVNDINISGIFMSVVSFCLYVFTEFYAFFYGHMYVIDSRVELGTRLFMIFLVFIFVSTAMKFLVNHTSNVEEGLEKKAEYDELTGLPNRHHMDIVFDQLFADRSVADYWVAMVDIDDFKKVNDTYGHTDGDIVLKSIANILKSYEPNVKVCRWGGEEFLLLGKVYADKAGLRSVLDDIRQRVAGSAVAITNTNVNVTITIGASEYMVGNSLEDWIQFADKKLYVGKYNGKNQVVC